MFKTFFGDFLLVCNRGDFLDTCHALELKLGQSLIPSQPQLLGNVARGILGLSNKVLYIFVPQGAAKLQVIKCLSASFLYQSTKLSLTTCNFEAT